MLPFSRKLFVLIAAVLQQAALSEARTSGLSRDLLQEPGGVVETAVRVKTATELKLAIREGASHILLTANITLTEQDFPEPPATCLDNSPDAATFTACAPSTVIYNPQDGVEDRKATWWATPGVVLDAGFLFRGIVLNRPLELLGITIAQALDDHNPYFFLFGSITDDPITYRKCKFLSPCAGKKGNGAQQLVDTLTTVAPLSTFLAANEQPLAPEGFTIDALMRFPVYGPCDAQIKLLEADIVCYDPASVPFKRNGAPQLWLPGSDTAAVREADACQRRETLGADYRGEMEISKSGHQCLPWDSQTPGGHTMTSMKLPTFGLGAHSHCRNPDHSEQGVWCYTASGREFCDVPECALGHAFDEETAGGDDDIAGLSKSAFVGVVVAVVGAIAVAALLAIWFCLDIKSKRKFEASGYTQEHGGYPHGTNVLAPEPAKAPVEQGTIAATAIGSGSDAFTSTDFDCAQRGAEQARLQLPAFLLTEPGNCDEK